VHLHVLNLGKRIYNAGAVFLQIGEPKLEEVSYNGAINQNLKFKFWNKLEDLRCEVVEYNRKFRTIIYSNKI